LTRSKSDAKVTLNNGITFEIEANSMVEIDDEGIVIQDGVVKVQKTRGNGIVKTKDGTIIDFTKGKVRIDQSDGKVNIMVSEGRVEITRKGEKQIIEKDENLSIDEKGQVVKQKINIRLTQPGDSVVLLTNTNKASAKLSWQTSTPATSYTISIGKTSSFSGARRYQTGQTEHTVSLSIGTWYWRVTAKGRNGTLLSSIRTLKIKRRQQIEVYTPRNNKLIVVAKGAEVPFRWRTRGSDSVKIEVSKQNNFAQVLTSRVTRQGSVSIAGLPEGQLFWRIMNQHERKPGSARIYPFRIKITEENIKIAEANKKTAEENKKPATDKKIDATKSDLLPRLQKKEARKEKKRLAELKRKKALRKERQRNRRPLAKARLFSPRGTLKTKRKRKLRLKFKWSRVKDANRYLLQVYQRRRGTITVLAQKRGAGTATRLTFRLRNAKARVFWRVKPFKIAAGKIQRQGGFSTASFGLRSTSLRPPRIKRVIVGRE